MSDVEQTEVQVQVDDFAPETGVYRHTMCGVEIELARNNRIPPCYRRACPNRQAPWIVGSSTKHGDDDAGA